MYKGYLTDVEGLEVGHETDLEGMTGCTVILCEEGATPGVDIRGSAPATREIAIFDPKKSVDRIHGLVLAGGSAYGLDSASGVMKYLEEKNIGFDVGVGKVPIVPGAVLFDMAVGDPKSRPDFNMGYKAAFNASKLEASQGNVGCGTGAAVGKVKGMEYAMKGGLGSATIKVGELVVSALVGVNALGDIFDYKTGSQMAGPFDKDKRMLYNGYKVMMEDNKKIGFEAVGSVTNTTIGVIGTNAKLNKSFANKVSEMAHNGYGRSINPVHTLSDGDTIFTMATNKVDADVNLVGTIAAEVMSQAIYNAICSAETYENIISYKDMLKILD